MIDHPAFQAWEVAFFSVVGPTSSKGSTGENDCNSPQDRAAVIHSHGRVWQWRKQDRVLQILNGQRNRTMMSTSPASGRQGACQMPLMPLRALLGADQEAVLPHACCVGSIFEAELVIGRALI